MSIATALTALHSDVENARNKIAEMGGTVTPNGGTSQLSADIATIPQGGGELPELTDPAAAGDVIAGKEYIDGAGAKRTGTLVVCDTVGENEYYGISGVGVNVELESSADWSTKIMTLPETNLLPENIKSGVNIFGVLGSAKKLRIESGTITPAEDTTTLTIPCSDNPKYAVILTTSDTTAEGDILGAIVYNILYAGKFPGNCVASYYYSGRIRSSALAATFNAGISIPEISSVCFYRAGTAYQWTAYYWEDE